MEKRLIVYNWILSLQKMKACLNLYEKKKSKKIKIILKYICEYLYTYVHWYAWSISKTENPFRLFRLEVTSCTVCDFYLRDDKDKRIPTSDLRAQSISRFVESLGIGNHVERIRYQKLLWIRQRTNLESRRGELQ